MARRKWDPASPAAQAGARRAEARSQDPDSGKGASALATEREHRQQSEAAVPFSQRERARVLPTPKPLGEWLAWFAERGNRLLALRRAPCGLVALVLRNGETEAAWQGCGTGRAFTDAEVAEYEGAEWVARWPFVAEDWD